MKYLSVCSGIEAASVAWLSLGWEAIAFSEIERFPSAVLAHHFPHVPNLGDMTEIDGTQFKGQVDVLIAGMPSIFAGKRKSLEDDRGNLTLKFVELADEINPPYIVWENVPGVLNTPDNAFGQFLGKLAGAEDELLPPKRWSNAGYVLGQTRNIAWRVLDSQYFGVAQRRRRVYAVACPRNGLDPREILFERNGLQRDIEKGKNQGDRATFGNVGNHNEYFTDTGFGRYKDTKLSGTLTRSGGNIAGGSETLISVHNSLMKPNCAARGKGWNNENQSYTLTTSDRHAVFYENNPSSALIKQSNLCPTIKARYGTGGGQTPLIMYENYTRDSRIKEVEVCPAIRKKMGGSLPIISRNYNLRRLMPIECERLQGFPDNYTQIPYRKKCAESCPDTPRYEALGNSMAVPVIKWLGERIMEAEYNCK